MRRTMKLIPLLALVLIPNLAGAAEIAPPLGDGVAPAEPPGFDLVGHSPLENRGMNAALAVHGDYAYVGSRTDAKAQNANNAGVFVVDISDTSAPEVVHQIGPPDEGNTGETSREMRIWHSQEVLIVMTLFSNCGEIHACTPVEGVDRFKFYDISGKNAAEPKLIATYDPSLNPHEFFLWEDPKRPKRALFFNSNTGGGAQQLTVTDISDWRKGKFTEIVKMSPLYNGGNLHSLSISPDGKTGYLAHLAGGVGVIDTSEIARNAKKPQVRVVTAPANAPRWEGPGPHSAVPLFNKDYMLITDEVYGEALRALGGHGCPWGWMRMVSIANPAKPKVVSDYRLEQNHQEYCTTDAPRPTSSYSAHNPTLTPNLAFITWHSGGLQAVDISNPKKPTQVTEYLPTPVLPVIQEDPVLSSGPDKIVMWSYPIIKNGLIYVVDVRNGLYILRYNGPFEKEVDKIKFLEGNSNLGDAVRLERDPRGVIREPHPVS